MKESEERQDLDKDEMQGDGLFEFFVVNISSQPLTGSVTWQNSTRQNSINVDGLEPGSVSGKKPFAPESGKTDYWTWDMKGREYQLNCYDGDSYAVVVISDYGIAVLVTDTSPDTWKW